MNSGRDEQYMGWALRLAMRGWGRTSPNPMVGALVVRDHRIVGRGYHARAGELHAERVALNAAGDAARGATLYVTLEPCTHYGRTPPCTEAVLESGVRRVVIGQTDPNPHVSGGGVELLRSRGLEVTTGVLEEKCARLNEAFTTFVTRNRPFAVLKLAASLDGKIATASGDSKWITSERSRRFVHRLRGGMDAVLVGGTTVSTDDPELTCRIPRGRDPVRIVLDSQLRLSPARRVFRSASDARALVCTRKDADPKKARILEAAGAEVVRVDSDPYGVSLRAVMQALAQRQITSVLIEGGSRVAASALRAGLVDKLYVFYAPKIIGGQEAPGMIADVGVRSMSGCLRVRDMRWRRVGPDLLAEGYLDQ